MNVIQRLHTLGRRCVLSCGIAALASLGAASTASADYLSPDIDYLYEQFDEVMNYRLFIPPSYATSGSQLHPLVIFVHGVGQQHTSPFVPGDADVCNSAQMWDNGQSVFVTPENQAIFPCFFALVQKQMGSAMPAHEAISGIIDELIGKYRVDPARVVVTGLSGGGAQVLQMAQYHYDQVAAIVPVCPAAIDNYTIPSGAGQMASWFFHAKGDGTTPANSAFGASRQFAIHGGRPIFTLYDSPDHHIWTRAYATPPLIPWLADQRLGQGPIGNPATVNITSPSTNPASVGTSSLSVSGTLSELSGLRDPEIASVRYSKNKYSYEYDNFTGAFDSGTGLWSTPNPIILNAPGTNTQIEVVALGKTFSTYYPNGATYYTSMLNATYSPGGDNTAPAVSITSPENNGSYSQSGTTINLGGTATDAVGVTSLEVHNNRNNITTSITVANPWSVSNIALLTGENLLTVKARDAANNLGTATLTVTVTTTPPPPPPPSTGWTGVKIDSTEGTHAQDGGVFTLTGRGEVWGGNSGMYYLYKQADGNCSITARVTSVGYTNWGYGKAGVMVRAAAGSGSQYVFMALTYNSGSVIYSGDAGSGTTWNVGVAPYWIRLTRTGNLFTGEIAPDGNGIPGEEDWTGIGSRTVVMPAAVTIGLGCSSNDPNASNTSTFDYVSTTGTPEEWQTADIGTTDGDAEVDGDVFAIAGKGVLWSTSDQVRYVYREASGDCIITARVASVQTTNWGYGRAGVMIRESITPGAKYVFHGITGGAGSALHCSDAGQGMTYGTGSAPYWVRLTRAGSLFTAEVSPTGATNSWTTIGSKTLNMGTPVLIGLGVFSNDGNVNTSTLDGVSIQD